MFILKILINFYHQDVADNRVEHKLYPIIAVDSLFTSKEEYDLQIYLDQRIYEIINRQLIISLDFKFMDDETEYYGFWSKNNIYESLKRRSICRTYFSNIYSRINEKLNIDFQKELDLDSKLFRFV